MRLFRFSISESVSKDSYRTLQIVSKISLMRKGRSFWLLSQEAKSFWLFCAQFAFAINGVRSWNLACPATLLPNQTNCFLLN
jgi:hypothetical protein